MESMALRAGAYADLDAPSVARSVSAERTFFALRDEARAARPDDAAALGRDDHLDASAAGRRAGAFENASLRRRGAPF